LKIVLLVAVAFAAHADPAGRKLLAVPVDTAGWHAAERVVMPPNVRLHFLPPCTPEPRPAEPLWPPVREAAANRAIGRLDRLRAILRTRPVAGENASTASLAVPFGRDPPAITTCPATAVTAA